MLNNLMLTRLDVMTVVIITIVNITTTP